MLPFCPELSRQGRIFFHWATLHPFEFCCTLLSYAEPYALCYTLLSYAAFN